MYSHVIIIYIYCIYIYNIAHYTRKKRNHTWKTKYTIYNKALWKKNLHTRLWMDLPPAELRWNVVGMLHCELSKSSQLKSEWSHRHPSSNNVQSLQSVLLKGALRNVLKPNNNSATIWRVQISSKILQVRWSKYVQKKSGTEEWVLLS